MEPPPSGQEAPRDPAPEQSERRPASRLLVSFQYVHVQLAGGAPWGFTLKGGLEHGEPLIISKVEDGGKAAVSQKIRSGDELVNINGTPLYGSRQEALILIKGSYRTLKMIIRRRNVPVIRPHSWHLAKLSEARTEAAAMPCPAEAFSLSWHSGCDTSGLSLPWTPLSHHCSTDKSSSLGSMESLEPPSQTYFEGSLSPIDQAMYQNKRDSAYSSFSASSTASDSALRPEENSPAEGSQPGLLPDPRYLQTGGEPAGLPPPTPPLAPGPQPASCTPTSPCAGFAKAAAPPPQPPVRQDSLRACNPLPEAPKGRWTSDTSLCARGKDPPGPGGLPSAGPAKGVLPTDQYYLLSSHTDPHPSGMDKGTSSTESLLSEQAGGPPLEDPLLCMGRKAQEGEWGRQEDCSSSWKAGWSAPLGHRHSAPEHLLATQLQALNVAPGQEGPRWTVSPLHSEQTSPGASEPWQDQDLGNCGSPGHAEDSSPCPAWGSGSRPPQGRHTGHERPRSASVELASSSPLQSPEDATDMGLQPTRLMDVSREGGQDSEVGGSAPRKGRPAQHRSAQMRRCSDRFATNLRHEIQWRKAQLQKAKGSVLLLGGEETVPEMEEPPSSSPGPPSQPPLTLAPSPPPPPTEARPHSFSPGARRWGSELSVFLGDHTTHSPGRALQLPPGPRWRTRELGPEWPPKPLAPAPGQSGRWHWSPEHKLQPHHEGQRAAPPEPGSHFPDESGLLPFADRRKFFEETSKPLPTGYTDLRPGRPGRLQPPKAEEPSPFQLVGAEHRALRRHSVDQAYGGSSSPACYGIRREAPGCCLPLARHRGDWDCWQPPPCSCAPREACASFYGERCPALHQRNLPVPTSHCAHRCHPRPAWGHCSDGGCQAPRNCWEEAGPWPARKEFQLEEWEPPAISRKSSQSMSELALHKLGLARGPPFWTCLESTKPEWVPFSRTTSTRNLSWDCERPGRATESPANEEAKKPPLRERALSESHLCQEPASRASGKDPREAPLARLEEGRQDSPGRAKKKGPPPPRPPPPNWEKYHLRRTSKASPPTPPEEPRSPSHHSSEAGRQRSQSLPAERLWKEAAQQQQQQACHAGPREAPSLGEQGSPHYYGPSATQQTPAMPMGQGGPSRPTSSLEKEAVPEPQWPTEPPGATGRTREEGRPAGDPRDPPSQEPEEASQGAAQEGAPPLAPAGPPAPFRMNSEELMREVVGQDRSLAGVLSPTLGRVTATEVMGGLFSPSNCPMWSTWDQQPQASGASPTKRQPAPSLSLPCHRGSVSPTSGSDYYNTPTGQAQMVDQETPEPVGANSEEEEELDHDLAQKKVQLIESISRKLAVLQEAQRGLQDDLQANTALGREVEGHVQGACKSQEYEKFRLFIGDLDKVVNLLLSLSGRLARVENILGGLDSDAPEEEKLALLEKKRQLMAQLEDAKELQEHVARREQAVFASVSRCLPGEQLQDYQHFVRMKSALAIQQRQLDDRIKLGKEQLRCLRDSLRRGPREY